MLFPSAVTILDGKEEEQGTSQDGQNTFVFGNENFPSFKHSISPDESRTTNVKPENKKRKISEHRELTSDSSCWSSDEFTKERKKSPENRKLSSDGSSSLSSGEKRRETRKKRKKKKKKTRCAEDYESSELYTQHKYHKTKKKKKNKKKQKSSKPTTVNKPDTIWMEETTLDAGQAYRKDNRPDRHNYEYGSLYKMDIAKFLKPVKIKCLGLSKHQRISLYPKKQKKLKTSDVRKSRYFLKSGITHDIQTDDEDDAFIHTLESEGFVPIKRNNVATESDKKIRTFGDDYHHSQQNRMFSQKLLDNPQDVRTWIEFVEAQNELVPWSHDDVQNKEHWVSSKVLCEKKVSIIEKALLKNPSSVDLVLRHMVLVKELWTPTDLKEKWKKLLFQFPNRSAMWLEYLTFLQAELIGMSINNVIDSYRKCFRMLLGIHCGTMKSHQPEVNSLDGILMVLVHLLLFLWMSGHTEKATTLVLCFLEFNLSTKSSLNLTEKLKLFEEYFESESERLGEENYQSWDEFTTNDSEKKQYRIPCITESPVRITGSSFDEILSQAKAQLKNGSVEKECVWVQLEKIRSGNDALGYHGDPDECEDTERIVLFDDISFALFSVSDYERLFQLVLVVLLSFGVPIPKARLNKNLYKEVCRYSLIIKSCDKLSDNRCFCRNCEFCDYVMISSEFYFTSCLDNEMVLGNVRRLLSQLIPSFDDAHVQLLSQIWFHFESILFRRSFEDLKTIFSKKYWKEMRKFIKGMLKLPSNRCCIVLWDMYAAYEWNLGNVEDSQKIFGTAIQLERGTNGKESCLSIAGNVRFILDLFLERTDDLLGEKNQLLNIYFAFLEPSKELSFSGNSRPNSLKLLKVSTLLKSEYNRLLSLKLNEWFTEAVHFMCCHVLFMFLFGGSVALNIAVEELLNFFESNSRINERGIDNSNSLSTETIVDFSDVLKYALIIMRGYVKQSNQYFVHYKPILNRCVRLSPCDDVINCFYIDVKKHGMNSLEVRRTFDNFFSTHVQQEHSLVTWLQYLKYEEQRLLSISLVPAEDKGEFEILDSKTGAHNRIRTLYQKVLLEDAFRYNSHIWCMFLSFLVKYIGKKHAQDRFYTALRNCPSSKALYTFGCEKLGNFKEQYYMMTEKEVRMRLLYEELDLLLLD